MTCHRRERFSGSHMPDGPKSAFTGLTFLSAALIPARIQRHRNGRCGARAEEVKILFCAVSLVDVLCWISHPEGR